MPLDDSPPKLGTEIDGQVASDTACSVTKGGAFTKLDQAVDEMVESSIDFMIGGMGFFP